MMVYNKTICHRYRSWSIPRTASLAYSGSTPIAALQGVRHVGSYLFGGLKHSKSIIMILRFLVAIKYAKIEQSTALMQLTKISIAGETPCRSIRDVTALKKNKCPYWLRVSVPNAYHQSVSLSYAEHVTQVILPIQRLLGIGMLLVILNIAWELSYEIIYMILYNWNQCFWLPLRPPEYLGQMSARNSRIL